MHIADFDLWNLFILGGMNLCRFLIYLLFNVMMMFSFLENICSALIDKVAICELGNVVNLACAQIFIYLYSWDRWTLQCSYKVPFERLSSNIHTGMILLKLFFWFQSGLWFFVRFFYSGLMAYDFLDIYG